MYLSHGLEEFFTAPPLQSPIVIILLAAADAQRTIASTRTSKESSSTQFHLAVVNPRHGRRDKVPVGFGIEVV
jgi:hypothetical protein